MAITPERQQQISDELDVIYKQMAELYDRVHDLVQKKFSPLSPEMQKARVEFDELNRKKLKLIKESSLSWINLDNPIYDAGLE